MVGMLPIAASDQEEFQRMAIAHFSELNPAFVPMQDWRDHYFQNVLKTPLCFLRWIICDGQRAGFILFGVEEHRFLPRKTGAIYELYDQAANVESMYQDAPHNYNQVAREAVYGFFGKHVLGETIEPHFAYRSGWVVRGLAESFLDPAGPRPRLP